MTFPTSLDEATKQTIFDWYQYRYVCDDDKFNVFFNRVLNRDLPQYNQLLRLEPGISDYDWMVEEYRETQRTHEGATESTSDVTNNVSRETSQNTEGTNSSSTTGSNNQTTTTGGNSNTTRTNSSVTEKKGKESVRDYTNLEGAHGTASVEGNYTVDWEKTTGKQTVTNGFDKDSAGNLMNTLTESTKKDGDEIHDTKSNQATGDLPGDGYVDTVTKDGTRVLTKKGDEEKNYDVASGNTKTAVTKTGSSSSTETPNTTDTTTNKVNQTKGTNVKNLTKTLPMSTGGSDFGSTTASLANNDIPSLTWSDASGMSEQMTTEAYSGDADEQKTTHSGTNETSGKTSDTENTTVTDNDRKTAHAVDTEEKETFSDYSETHTVQNTTDRTETTHYNNYEETHTTTDDRQTVQTTAFPDNIRKEHFENFDTKHDTSFEDRKDETNGNDTEVTTTSGDSTVSGTTGSETSGTTSQTVTGKGTDTTTGKTTQSGSDTTLDREVTTGRHGEPAEILARAAGYIKMSSAWSWLNLRLEPCFLGIYEV